MLYAQIKKTMDQKYHKKLGILIKDELFTMTEIKRYSIPEYCYDVMNYPKNKSYFIFGTRYNSAQNR